MASGKVLIIDDSVLVRNYLSKTILEIPNLEVVDSISNGINGLKRILELQPDVVILDLEMADGDGLYVLQSIEKEMSFSERPFVLIYSSRARYDDPIFRKAIDFGFCDFVLKVEGTPETIIPHIKAAFIPKILSGIEAKHTRSLLGSKPSSAPIFQNKEKQHMIQSSSINNISSTIVRKATTLDTVLQQKNILPRMLIIGASTGGPQVIRSILQNIDSNINIPIVIIQHMPEKFTQSFAIELTNSSSIPTHELRHNMSLEKGHAYIFPGGVHGRINAFGNIYVYYTDRNNYDAHPFKPSIDLAIKNLLDSFHGHVLGVILSGMGTDGALGMKALHDKGSLIFAQDEQSSIVWGMPGSAVKQNAVDLVLSQQELGPAIVKALTFYGVYTK